MPSTYRHEVLESEPAQRYRHWLKDELAKSGDDFLDVSAPRSIGDADFSDGIHLDADGARRFSIDLGELLGPIEAQGRP